ncbi:MAG: hypothetical protein QM796_08020 [Chthoniobacteraceae bacterium]
MMLEHLSAEQIANASNYVFENQGLTLVGESISFLLTISSRTVAEKAERMLRFIGQNAPPGRSLLPGVWQSNGQMEILNKIAEQPFPVDKASENACENEFPYLAASGAIDQDEAYYLVFIYLLELGFLKSEDAQGTVIVTPLGWKEIQTRQLSEGTIAFVAMWFDPQLTEAWKGPITRGVRKAGYEPFRVDQKEHNNDVSDEIIAAIRTSKFVLADFTGHRGGVYYEAGFAAGLGKEVIRTVRKDHVGAIHFDTRQLNHIIWDVDDLANFENAITNRIIATVGRGPLL